MRHFFIAIATFLGVCSTGSSAKAQEYGNAIGIKFGTYSGITYKLFVSRENAIEAGFTFGNNTLGFTGSYQFFFPIKEVPHLNWFVGGGGHLIFISGHNSLWNDSNHDNNIALGVNGVGGVEYKFPEIPLNIGAELGPCINLADETKLNVHLGIFARYTF